MLFIVDTADGSVIKAIDADVGPDNGLSSPAPIDKDGDELQITFTLVTSKEIFGNLIYHLTQS